MESIHDMIIAISTLTMQMHATPHIYANMSRSRQQSRHPSPTSLHAQLLVSPVTASTRRMMLLFLVLRCGWRVASVRRVGLALKVRYVLYDTHYPH